MIDANHRIDLHTIYGKESSGNIQAGVYLDGFNINRSSEPLRIHVLLPIVLYMQGTSCESKPTPLEMMTYHGKCTPFAALLIVLFSYSCTNYTIPGDDPPVDPGDEIIPVDDPGNESHSDCDPDTVYFQNSVLPLVVSSCGTAGCHDQESHRDGIILTDYASIITTGKIKPGDPGDSEFFESLTDKDDDLMPPPPLSPLSEDQIFLLENWILQGAKDNECVDGCDTSNITFTATIWPIMQNFCAGCHNPVSPGGGVVIAGYDDVVALSDGGSLMGTIRYENGYSPMPTNQQLDPCKIDQIQQWIDLGYPE